MKIVFIEPASPYVHVFSRFKLPRLGSLLLGTILKEAGHEVRVYADDVLPAPESELKEADLVAISTITATAPRAYELADSARAMGKTVIVGGPHVTFMPDEALEHADFVFKGEAEEAILPFMDALSRGDGFEEIPGLSFRRGTEAVHNPVPRLVPDLDALPFPDLSLLQGGFSSAFSNVVIPVMTSRGCPFDCEFCSVTQMFGRGYRFRSAENVMAELRGLDLRRKHVFFYDDNFAANRRRAKALMHVILEDRMKFEWSTQVRVELARDEELVELMARAGCKTLYIGFESTNPATLREYNKKQTVEDIEHAIRVFHRHRIRLHGMFVFGAEEDTVDTIKETVGFAKRNRIESVQFLILTPLPGTRYYERLNAQGRIIIKDWSLYDAHHAVYEPARMSAYELHLAAFNAIRSFYSNWEILKQALKCNVFNTLVKLYGRSACKIFAKQNKVFLRKLAQISPARKKAVGLA